MIDHLKARLQKPLPGVEAQVKMAHGMRKRRVPTPKDARLAGVMVLFFPVREQWNTVFIKRPSRNENDKHSGQISFPGGQYEKQDVDLAASAVRETREEIGVPEDKINLLGQLTELYIPVSNFLVKPFVGYTESKPDFTPEPGEVDDILETPVSSLLDPNNKQWTQIEINESVKLENVPYFNIDGHVIWGATAMILSELIELLPEKVKAV